MGSEMCIRDRDKPLAEDEEPEVIVYDPKAPDDSVTRMPYAIYHAGSNVKDHEEYYHVAYKEPILCKDGRMRGKCSYHCKGMGVITNSEEHLAKRARAHKMAWAHIHRHGDFPMTPYGRGPIVQDGPVCYHAGKGSKYEFNHHPSTPGVDKSFRAWNVLTDTAYLPDEFCTNCSYVSRDGEGIETWRCNGHDRVEGHAVSDVAKPFQEPEEDPIVSEPLPKTLEGKRMVETFSGNPEKGGESLSRAWEARGGTADRRDILINKSHDFFRDHSYWEKERRAPGHVYSFAPKCTTFSIAHTTPIVRTKENPTGDESNPAVKEANDLSLIHI